MPANGRRGAEGGLRHDDVRALHRPRRRAWRACSAKDADAKQYGDALRRHQGRVQPAYVDGDGQIKGDTQAGYALALHFDLLAGEQARGGGRRHGRGHRRVQRPHVDRLPLDLPDDARAVARRALGRRLHADQRHDVPVSWGYSIENGATTIWERWDGYVKGRGFQDKGMNSFNHYAIGAVGEWMYRVMLGINTDDAHPGYKHFVMRPRAGRRAHVGEGLVPLDSREDRVRAGASSTARSRST